MSSLSGADRKSEVLVVDVEFDREADESEVEMDSFEFPAGLYAGGGSAA